MEGVGDGDGKVLRVRLDRKRGWEKEMGVG